MGIKLRHSTLTASMCIGLGMSVLGCALDTAPGGPSTEASSADGAEPTYLGVTGTSV